MGLGGSTPTSPTGPLYSDNPRAIDSDLGTKVTIPLSGQSKPSTSVSPTAPPPTPTASAPEVQQAEQAQDQRSTRGQAANMLSYEDTDPSGLLGKNAPKTSRNILLGA